MPTHRVHLETLLSRMVRDSAGKRAGRIEEVRAETHGDECLVIDYMLGPAGLMRRLAVGRFVLALLSPLGIKSRGKSLQIPWQQMDLTEPKRPRLRCRKDELR